LKRFVLLTMFVVSSFSSQINVEKKIYKMIFSALFPSNSVVKVWSDEPSKTFIFASMKKVKLVKSQNNADILMLYHNEEIDTNNKIVFANGYLVFQRKKGKAVGGFYWQKGRPNLIFVKKILQKKGIVLPDNLKKYIEDIK